MAYINVSMTEAISFINNNAEYNRDRIKNIKIINGNQVEVTISIGRFFPDMKVVAAYNSFREGKLYFSIITRGGIKIIMGLINEMGGKALNDYMKLENDMVQFDINKFTADSLKGVTVRDINMSGEQVYVTIDFKS